jgi:hypothetical protein
VFWDIIKSLDKPNIQNNPIEIEYLFDHFKSLNECDIVDDVTFDEAQATESLDCPITEAEITSCITNLKNNKVCGLDIIYNEYIKASSCIMMPAYVKLFNLILDKGVFPET